MNLEKFALNYLPLKSKYKNILISQLPKEINIEKFSKLGDVTIELFLYEYNFKNATSIYYDTFLNKIIINLDPETLKAYVAFFERVLDEKTRIGVGYGVAYNTLSSLIR